ncbi:uncharacterized protein LOC134233254 [Saccostrea cucullata]|uniref:uncharacterized protein LOC134233254 n=1 Tax=Saccostrea cuccullata TaxID=36930 RepID=UPI002ED5B606
MRALYVFVIWFALQYNRENVMCQVQRYTWFDAQEICRMNNSVLIKKAMHNSSESFWIGHYRRKSTWIKITGCYPEKILQTFSVSYDMQQIPSAGFCQEICLSFNKTVFAIKGSECKCLHNPPSVNEELPSDTCNVTCNIRADAHYIGECGGQMAYSVFQSDMKNNKYSTNGSFCIGIHCTAFPKFYFESNCNQSFKSLCQRCDIPEKRPFETWSGAMKYCKSANPSSYLFSDVFLNDINKTCISVNSVFTQPSWLGVAAELYSGIDYGNEIKEEEKEYYNECMKCDTNECKYTFCSEKLVEKVYCMKNDNPAENFTENGLYSEFQNAKNLTCKPKGENKPSLPEESNVFKIVIPVVVVISCLIGGCCIVFLKLRERTQKQSAKTTNTRNCEERGKHPESNKDVTEDHDYFTLESQEKCTKISNYPNVDFTRQSKDNNYDHLRGTFAGTEVANRENDYDTVSKTTKLECHFTWNTEENYDHLRERIVNNEDNINSGYSHVSPHTSEQSDYDVASKINNTEISSIYSHLKTNQ